MTEKEVDEYIKVQKSLGVQEKEIHKALTSAGYTEDEFRHLLEKHKHVSPRNTATGRAISAKSRVISQGMTMRHILALNLVMLVFFGALAAYITYDYNKKLNILAAEQETGLTDMETQLSEKTTALDEKLAGELTSMESRFDKDLTETRVNMATKDQALEKQITDYRMESFNRDTTLTDSIQGVSSTSESSMTQFAQELAEFRDKTVDFTPIIPKAMDSVVVIGEQGAGYFTTAGAGVMMNDKGLIVTNYHVIDELGRITVKLNDGTDYFATVVGHDPDMDVAVIQLTTQKDGFQYMQFADSNDAFVGQHVIAIGNPVGFDSTVTEGIISNTDRSINSGDRTYLQTDVAVNSGNSGGPLIDKEGKIIGIVTLKYARSGYEGLSFALKSNDVNSAVYRILQEA